MLEPTQLCRSEGDAHNSRSKGRAYMYIPPKHLARKDACNLGRKIGGTRVHFSKQLIRKDARALGLGTLLQRGHVHVSGSESKGRVYKHKFYPKGSDKSL
jgi:hypothetical protein